MAYTYEINPRPAALGGGWAGTAAGRGRGSGGRCIPCGVRGSGRHRLVERIKRCRAARWLQQSEGLGTAANAYVAYLRAQAYSDAEETAAEWLNSRNELSLIARKMSEYRHARDLSTDIKISST